VEHLEPRLSLVGHLKAYSRFRSSHNVLPEIPLKLHYHQCLEGVLLICTTFTATLLGRGGNILAATKSSFFGNDDSSCGHSATAYQPGFEWRHCFPAGTFAGTCNCNSIINANVPTRSPGVVVELKALQGDQLSIVQELECAA